MNQQQIQIGKFALVQDWPPEILPELKKHLRALEPMIPGWCSEVLVTWYPTKKGVAEINVSYDYRTATIRICSEYLSQTSSHRLYCLRHEVFHLSTNAPMIYAEQVVREILPDGENDLLRNRILTEMREKHEGCVEDLGMAFERAGVLPACKKTLDN